MRSSGLRVSAVDAESLAAAENGKADNSREVN